MSDQSKSDETVNRYELLTQEIGQRYDAYSYGNFNRYDVPRTLINLLQSMMTLVNEQDARITALTTDLMQAQFQINHLRRTRM